MPGSRRYALREDKPTRIWFASQRAVEYHVALGVHVYVPVQESVSAHDAAAATRARAQRAARLDPGLATTAFIKADRGGLVFIDSTRAHGATVVAVYSPRARPGVPVSFPVAGESLGDVVVSNDAANATATRLGRGVITVVPVISTTGRIYPFQVLSPARRTRLPRNSKAQAEQVRSVAVERVGERRDSCPPCSSPNSTAHCASISASDGARLIAAAPQQHPREVPADAQP